MFIRMVSHWAGHSLGWSLISLVSQAGLSSGWSLNRLVFQAGLSGCFSSGWSLRPFFHQAGLLGRFLTRPVSQAGPCREAGDV